MIEFPTVSREFRSLVHRRQELVTFLGVVFAATGIFLQNVLQGKLPPALQGMQEYIFAFYALMLMVPTLILALRMARLHGGMVLNGILYARLMQEQDFTARGDPQRAARHNFLSVAFLQFVQMDLIAGFSAAILALGLGADLVGAVLVGVVVALVWLGLYFRFHHQAVRFALSKIATDTCGPVERKDWREHLSSSLEGANTGMLADIGFVGLIMFSMFEKLSGLGEIRKEPAGPAYGHVLAYGPWIFTTLMVVTCLFGLLTYLRVRLAIGQFSLQLDPTDRPFRPLRLTDSLLGYLLLAFLFTVSLHLLLLLGLPDLDSNRPLLLGIDAAALLLAVAAEQLTLVVAGRRYHQG
jgi:hypothetical protein